MVYPILFMEGKDQSYKIVDIVNGRLIRVEYWLWKVLDIKLLDEEELI